MKTTNAQDRELTVVFGHNQNLQSCEELFTRTLDDGQEVIGFEKSGKYYVVGYLKIGQGWDKFYSCTMDSRDGYGTVHNTGYEYYDDIESWKTETE